MRQIHHHIEKLVFAQFYVNGEPTDMLEGLKKGDEVWVQWHDRNGRKWEGLITDTRRVNPEEGVPGVVEIRFKVPRPISLTRRRRRSHA